MEKNFPESETLSIKRLKVAVDKKNWDLFEKGLKKTWELKNFGYKFKQLDLWQNFLLWAESKEVHPDLWYDLRDFVDSISQGLSEVQVDSGIIEEYQEEITDLIDKNVAIIYNQSIDKNILSAVKRHRINLNNIIYNPAKYNPDYKWLEDLSGLINEFNKPQEELKGFVSLVSLFKKNGSIITNSYSNNIEKMLVNSNINVIFPDIKTELGSSEKFWEYYSLGGKINTFICSKCHSRTLKKDYHSKTMVECCPKCGGAMYPDIAYIGEEHSEINPKVWYGTYDKLCSAKIWIILNPPAQNEQTALKNIIFDAAKKSDVSEIHLITHNIEVFDWWKSRLLNFATKAEIKGNYTDIASFLETYNEISAVKK